MEKKREGKKLIMKEKMGTGRDKLNPKKKLTDR